jgi:hypothetical protein
MVQFSMLARCSASAITPIAASPADHPGYFGRAACAQQLSAATAGRLHAVPRRGVHRGRRF